MSSDPSFTKGGGLEVAPYQAPWFLIVMNVVQAVGFLGGIVANVLLVTLFVMSPRLKIVTNIILFQRAIADMIALLYIPFFIYTTAAGPYTTSNGACKFFSIITHVGVVASIVLLMAFTMDSFLASRPQEHTLLFKRKAMTVSSAAAWVLAVIAGIVAGVNSQLSNGSCNYSPLFEDSFQLVGFQVVQFILLTVIPLVVVWVFVGLGLPPRSSGTAVTEYSMDEDTGPNRRLMLGLAVTFTVVQGITWLTHIIGNVVPSVAVIVICIIIYSFVSLMELVNGVLVICLTQELQLKLAKWLPIRYTAGVPMQTM